MKKHWSEPSYKRFNETRSQNTLKRNLKSKGRKKNLRRANQGKPKERQLIPYKRRPKVSLPVPENFSFIDNTAELLKYIKLVENSFLARKDVLIDFTNVKNITNDAIVLLLSKVRDPTIIRNCTCEGNYPDDIEMKETLMESGLFLQIKMKHGSKHSNTILTRKYKRAEGYVADELIRRATKAIHGEEGRCPGVYRALMEVMANTCFHAIPDKKGTLSWWLTVYHNKRKDFISFAFVDTGVGIFQSRKIHKVTEYVKKALGISDNITILKEILGSGLSRTNLPYRGHGLPAVYKGLERNYYRNLRIISNNVYADIERDNFVTLRDNFKGTFLYWELHKDSRWIRFT